jgi:hypothetical protein
MHSLAMALEVVWSIYGQNPATAQGRRAFARAGEGFGFESCVSTQMKLVRCLHDLARSSVYWTNCYWCRGDGGAPNGRS